MLYISICYNHMLYIIIICYIYTYIYTYICPSIYSIYCFGLNTVKDTFVLKSEAAVLSFPLYSCSDHFWTLTKKIPMLWSSF